MSKADFSGTGTKEDPWVLKTPPGKSEYLAWREEVATPPAVVVLVSNKYELRYHLSCLEDLHAMLKDHSDWMLLGNKDEQKPAKEGTVEAWGPLPG